MSCILLALSAATAPAQRGRKTSRLRALALLEIGPNGKARLVPIAIKVGDKFYDAGLYRANPVPMSLGRDTVYEAMRTGEPVGLFTVTSARSVKGVWVGVGQWRPLEAPPPETKPADAPAPPQPPDDEPPVLRKPGSEPAPPPTEKTDEAQTPPPKPTEPAKPSSPPPQDDSDRPLLRRGRPAEAQATDEEPPETAAKPGAGHVSAKETATTASAAGPIAVYTAISDAAGPDTKPYLMALRPDEQMKYRETVKGMAYAAIQKFAAARPQVKPGPAAELTDIYFNAYDLHYNNQPEMVMSARLPQVSPTGGRLASSYFVTVVATVDMYGDVRQLFASVTDSSHLDAYPRLELIDAVDAQGSGTGQLLFRKITDNGYRYVVYRVGMDRLWPVFEGAGSRF